MPNNDDRMDELLQAADPVLKTIKDLLKKTDTPPFEIVKVLYYLLNIQKMSGFGEVGFKVKDGRVTQVWQSQHLLSEEQMLRDLNKAIGKRVEF